MSIETTTPLTTYDNQEVSTSEIEELTLYRDGNIESTHIYAFPSGTFGLEQLDSDEQFGPVYEAEAGHYETMGVTVEEGGCNAAILVGEGVDFVEVCRYDKSDPNKAIERRRLTKKSDEKNAFYGFMPGWEEGDLYGIRAYGKWEPGNKLLVNPYKLLVDPHAKAISGKFIAVDEERVPVPQVREELNWIRFYMGMNTQDSAPFVPRSVVINTNNYDWESDEKPSIPEEQAIIYETHIKDMTMLHPNVPENQRGTYAGMANPAVIKHLVDLGITSVELMPVQQFVSDIPIQIRGLTNHWGYQTIGFYAPHGEYSSAGQNGEQVNEFKDMVKAFHAAGIEVFLDVVYGHTPEGNEEGPTLGPKGIMNKEFYHYGDGVGTYNDDSGCGNTVNASSEIGLNYIMDSLRYWAGEMHVDGFRFDLAPNLARVSPSGRIDMEGPFMAALEDALATDPILSQVKVYAEPWDLKEVVPDKYGPRWNVWNGKNRDLTRKFMLRHAGIRDLHEALAKPEGMKGRPVNFVTVHDGFTLQDLVSYSGKHNLANLEQGRDGTDDNISYNFGHEGPTDNPGIANIRYRVMRTMLATVLTSPGIPILSHGDELGRTQNGNNNAYCQDNEMSWINWDLTEEQQAHLRFVSALGRYRRYNPIFEKAINYNTGPILGENNISEDGIAWFRHNGKRLTSQYDPAWRTDPKVLGMYLPNTENKKTKSRRGLMVYTNGTHHDFDVALPEAPYSGDFKKTLDTSSGLVSPEGQDIPIEDGKFTLGALSLAVLVRK